MEPKKSIKPHKNVVIFLFIFSLFGEDSVHYEYLCKSASVSQFKRGRVQCRCMFESRERESTRLHVVVSGQFWIIALQDTRIPADKQYGEIFTTFLSGIMDWRVFISMRVS